MTDRNSKMAWVLTLLFPVVFNVLFFAYPIKRTAFTWICYAFIHLAYFLLVYAIYFTNESSQQYRNRTTVIPVTAIYFVIELIVGVTLIILQSILFIVTLRARHALMIQGLLFVVFFAIALFLLLANRHDEQVETVQAIERQFIQGSAESVRALLDKGPSLKANKAIEAVYDKLRTSPVASSPEAQQIEAQIRSRVHALSNMTTEEEILGATSEIMDLIQTRNSVLRMGQ